VDRQEPIRTARIVVLVVDDQPTVRAILGDLLREEGYEVVEAANGRVAAEILTKQVVDVVITDVRMPQLSGRGLYEYIERHHQQLRDKVFVITGHPGEDTEFFEDRTRTPIFYKPFKFEALLDAIHAALRSENRADAR